MSPKKKVRDSQRSRVRDAIMRTEYGEEPAYSPSKDAQAEEREIVSSAWYKAHFGLRQTGSMMRYRRVTDLHWILYGVALRSFPKDGMPLYMEDKRRHGRGMVASYVALVQHYCGVKVAADLKAKLRERKVKFNKPIKLSDEHKAKAQKQLAAMRGDIRAAVEIAREKDAKALANSYGVRCPKCGRPETACICDDDPTGVSDWMDDAAARVEGVGSYEDPADPMTEAEIEATLRTAHEEGKRHDVRYPVCPECGGDLPCGKSIDVVACPHCGLAFGREEGE